MKEVFKKEKVIFVGDSHGVWESVDAALEPGALLIHVGDVGLGFNDPAYDDYKLSQLSKKLSDLGSEMILLRGNHDDPSCWRTYHRHPRVYLTPDYSSFVVNQKKVLVVGGGVSVDRTRRTPGSTYWVDEEVVEKKLDSYDYDIIVSHSAPNYFPVVFPSPGDIVETFSEVDPKLKEDIAKERAILDRLFENISPDLWVFGHFHRDKKGSVKNTQWHCVDQHTHKVISLDHE